MNEKTQKIPRLRFPEFTYAWEQEPLKNLVNVHSGKDYKHLSEGDIPVYGTGGYMLSVNEALSEKDDAIGIGRKGTIDKPYILKAPFWTVDTLFYAIPKEKNDLHFIFSLFQKINWKNKDESTGVPSLSKSTINSTHIHTTHYEEQQKLGQFFRRLDRHITIHQRKLEKTKKLKAGLLQKMFPASGEKTPKIRFSGFEGEWKQEKMGSIFGKICNAFVGTATPYYVENGHFYLESNNVKDGNINRNSEIFINDEFYQAQKDKWLKTGDLVMVQSGHVGHCAVIPEELNNSAAHALIIFTEHKFKTNPYFINFFFQTTNAKYEIQKITTGNTIKHILASDMKEFVIDIPTSEEQQKIGQFFQKIDRLIKVQQRELDNLKNLKKALLQQMFV